MRSLSVSGGLLLVLLVLLGLSCGHKKEDGAGCVIQRQVCTELAHHHHQVTECAQVPLVRRCFTVTKSRARRSPGLLQALLLYQALNTRHPERAEPRREVRCHLVPTNNTGRCHNNIITPARQCSVQLVNIC